MSDFYDDPIGTGRPNGPVTVDPPRVPETLTDPAEPVGEEVPSPGTADPEEAKQESVESPAVTRFNSCRWHEKPDDGASYCANRDVLPFAGKHGFNPEAWCPDCKLYKVKRTVKKRNRNDWDEY